MRKNVFLSTGVFWLLSLLLLSGCGSRVSDELTAHKSFKGYTTNTYYKLNSNGVRALKVTGRPFMIVKYLKVDSEYAADCYFGLSDVKQFDLGVSPAVAPDTNLLKPADIESSSQFNFPANSNILLLVDWEKKAITRDRGNDFFFDKTLSDDSTKRVESWELTFDSDSVKRSATVKGTVKNIDTSDYKGNQSDVDAFSLNAL